MAVGLRFSFFELTLKDYDRICEVLKFPADWPDGLLAHGSHEAEGHLVVNDVWESRQHFDRYSQQRLQTAMAEAVGDRVQEPEIIERELHTFYAR
ncbi:MAG: hypothetical protein ACM4D3_16145 [Candidatus Sericytochromatia bacterium]